MVSQVDPYALLGLEELIKRVLIFYTQRSRLISGAYYSRENL